MTTSSHWNRFQKYFLRYDESGISVDVSRMRFPDDFISGMQPRAELALRKMVELEAGAIANPDENRMVGHYWLRAPQLAPTAELKSEIGRMNHDVRQFAEAVHGGGITAANGAKFTDLLVAGIGGSALGPQFVADALGGRHDWMAIHFIDNTDPDGFDKVFDRIDRRSQKIAGRPVEHCRDLAGCQEEKPG